MRKPTKIHKNIMLKQLDIRWNHRGDKVIFSVKFVDLKGRLHFFPYAICRGLRYNVTEHRQRGIQPVTENGDPIDHVYPVNIDLFTQYNSMEVMI